MTDFYTSDLHFGHPFVAALRGYAKPGWPNGATIREVCEREHVDLWDVVDWERHDRDLLDAINSVCGQEDTLTILGDLSSGASGSARIAESFQFDRPEVLCECHGRNELEKAIKSAQAGEREGVVLYYADGWMVKVKSDHYLRVKSLRPLLKHVLLNGKPTPMDDSERSRLVRTVLEKADPDRLIYRRIGFDEPDVDMTYVGTLVD